MKAKNETAIEQQLEEIKVTLEALCKAVDTLTEEAKKLRPDDALRQRVVEALAREHMRETR